MNSRNKIKNKLLIFDLDGTLYNFHGGSFKDSSLKDAVWERALQFIGDRLMVDEAEAQSIFEKIRNGYGENISIGLEKEYGLNRWEYFGFTWDLSAKDYIIKSPAVGEIISSLAKDNRVIVLSDAPRVWIISVLKELGLYEILKDSIRSGEGDTRKIFGNAFAAILKEFNIDLRDCVVIGDQEETDVIPAKNLGLKTILISEIKSEYADSTIRDISEVERAIENIIESI